MNKENASKLWKIIQEAGDYLCYRWHTLPHTSYVDYPKFIKNNSDNPCQNALLY